MPVRAPRGIYAAFRITTMIGRLARYATDAMMVSTVLAGIKHATGLSPDLERISEPSIRSGVQQYLNAGDYVFGAAVSFAQNSNYFRAYASSGHVSLFGEDGNHLRQFPSPPKSGNW